MGEATRSSTLSFSQSGQPVPALHNPRIVFNRLFGKEDRTLQVQRQELQNSGNMLDLVLDHSKSVQRKLGKQDQKKSMNTSSPSARSSNGSNDPKSGSMFPNLGSTPTDSTPMPMIKPPAS
ncbi:MAG: DUF1552 domain-containing protein [Akkermansiaceae bacterium]|nr:DUF1552 domain-containing protein [Akkermansiaceae bacterium]